MELPAGIRGGLGVLSVLTIVNVLIAHRTMLRLQRQSPDVMQRAGILRVDWWWRCLLGMFRLAFLDAGKSLDNSGRWVFRGIVFSYAWLSILSLLILAGRIA